VICEKNGDGRHADRRFGKPSYAAARYSPIRRIQPVSGFQLVKIWATNSKLLILNT
jgi:hypothetical protein